jgi:serine protease
MIPAPRRYLLCTSSIAAISLLVVATHGQTLSPRGSARTLLSNFAPPAVQQGVNPDTSYWPGSPEMRQRRAGPQMLAASERVNALGIRYKGDRVIVKFRDGVTAASRESALSAVTPRGSMAPRSAWQNFDVVEIAGTDDAEAAAASYRARADVEYAQAAYRVQADQASTDRFVPNDRFYPAQWNLHLMGLELVWKIQPAAASAITVAVLDTGVAFADRTLEFTAGAFCVDSARTVQRGSCPGGGGYTQYPALGVVSLAFAHAPELEPLTRFVAPHDFIWDDVVPVDLGFHGTHVAGTLGQLTNNGAGQGDTANGGGTAGVAFNIRLMPVKVISTEWDEIFGAPHQGTDDRIALGIRYAVDNGAKVINMSIGRSGPNGCGANRNLNGCAPVVEDAMRYAVCAGARSSTCSGAGAFIAVSGGNDFLSGNRVQVYAEIASRVSGAVSVAAVTREKRHASYSNTGNYIELAAPGGDNGPCSTSDTSYILQQTLDIPMVQTFTQPVSQFGPPRFDIFAYFCLAGTSQAAPHIAGVAAMLMQQGITDPAAVETALEQYATPCSESIDLCDVGQPVNRNSTFGFGLVVARGALYGQGLVK